MKKLFFILLLLGFIFQLNAGIRAVKLNCPYMDTSFDCIQVVDGEVHFCLFLQRTNVSKPLINSITNIRISINGVQDTLIPLSDFSQNSTINVIEYTKLYSTSTPIGTDGFVLLTEILMDFCVFQVPGAPAPCTTQLYDGEIFHTIEDNSTSDNIGTYTQFINICSNNNNILEEETCINSGGFMPTQKISNTGNLNQKISNKISANKFIDIYPNPFNEFITINMAQNSSENSLISLYDAKGKVVKQINTAGNNIINEKIRTENLPIGLYVCEIITGNERKNFKLLKTN